MPRRNLNLQRRNSELTKKFGARRRVPLRRLRGGGQSARSSFNVIGWCHTVEYGSLKLAFILCYFCETHDLVWEIISVPEKRMTNCIVKNY